jgi:hypothetical protein
MSYSRRTAGKEKYGRACDPVLNRALFFRVLSRLYAVLDVGGSVWNWWAVYPPKPLYKLLFLIGKYQPQTGKAPVGAPLKRWLSPAVSGHIKRLYYPRRSQVQPKLRASIEQLKTQN